MATPEKLQNMRTLLRNFGMCGVHEHLGPATAPLYHVTGKPSVPSILRHGLRGRPLEDEFFFAGKGPLIWLQRDLMWAKCQVQASFSPQPIVPTHGGMALLEVDVTGWELYSDPHAPSLEAYETFCLVYADVIPPERITEVEVEAADFGAAGVRLLAMMRRK